jgi:ABC-2 type transport system ATP-binding protein
MTAASRSTAAVEAVGVGVRYGSCTALRDVSLTIDAGHVFALLGPNGAGKTSLVEILAGFARPAAGRARVLGLDPFADRGRLRSRVGIMLQRAGSSPT